MFRSLKNIAYKAGDMEKAGLWYRQLLNMEPVIDSPLLILFRIGESQLMLVPATNEEVLGKDGTVAYWDVDDANEAYKRLLELGAVTHTDVSISIGNNRIARVYDPFGNIIGIISKPSDKKKSLEDKPSESALTVAFCRAISAHDERDMFNCGDHLAELFLNEEARNSLDNPASRAWLFKYMMTPGVYEFFIARTKYIDSVFTGALSSNIPQIVFLGAGYDSRPYRYADKIRDAKVFELDAAPTQQRKTDRLKQGNTAIPSRLVYVPMNFERQTFKEVLEKAGFDRHLKTLFIWEGVTYYLSQAAIDSTLGFIRENSPSGSVLCFDYILDAPDLLERYGTKVALEMMKSVYEAESARFTIAEGTIGEFMSERGFNLIEHLTPEEVSSKYFTLPDGTLAARITEMFCFVKAEVK